MKIQFIEPLSQGISRMRRDLFNPFDLKKWFIVGFTAFLAGLIDGGSSGNPFTWRNMGKGSRFDPEGILFFPQRAWQWLAGHQGWAIFIVIMIFLVFIIGIILGWLGCRGKFMFLDNVVHGRAQVVAPWYEYRKEANSFFLFNLIWSGISLAIFVAYVALCFIKLQAVYVSGANGRAMIMPVILAVLGFIVYAIINLFLLTLIKNFVVLIMYRDRISTLQAIQKFIPLFLSQFIYFLGFELFLLCLSLLVIIGTAIAGCITCCIGFIILMIPYINAVILLPIPYALRAFSIEFLEQFGPEYQILPRPDINPAPQQVIEPVMGPIDPPNLSF
jgi:hypothetical protein